MSENACDGRDSRVIRRIRIGDSGMPRDSHSGLGAGLSRRVHVGVTRSVSHGESLSVFQCRVTVVSSGVPWTIFFIWSWILTSLLCSAFDRDLPRSLSALFRRERSFLTNEGFARLTCLEVRIEVPLYGVAVTVMTVDFAAPEASFQVTVYWKFPRAVGFKTHCLPLPALFFAAWTSAPHVDVYARPKAC